MLFLTPNQQSLNSGKIFQLHRNITVSISCWKTRSSEWFSWLTSGMASDPTKILCQSPINGSHILVIKIILVLDILVIVTKISLINSCIASVSRNTVGFSYVFHILFNTTPWCLPQMSALRDYISLHHCTSFDPITRLTVPSRPRLTGMYQITPHTWCRYFAFQF